MLLEACFHRPFSGLCYLKKLVFNMMLSCIDSNNVVSKMCFFFLLFLKQVEGIQNVEDEIARYTTILFLHSKNICFLVNKRLLFVLVC